jgi:Cu-Zn family superoxide dismutase
MPRLVSASFLSAAVVTLAVGCGGGDDAPDDSSGGNSGTGAEASGGSSDDLTATLADAKGTKVGTVELSTKDGGVEVSVEVTGLPPGFHGFHLHSVGVCEPDSVSPTDPSMKGDFLSAGGHIGAKESHHGEHPGDLPTLFVEQSGAGSLEFVTDAVTLADLTDDDGSAVMVHADRDNYANIPERYAPAGPDEMTLNTGDAGGRIACGVIEGSGQAGS